MRLRVALRAPRPVHPDTAPVLHRLRRRFRSPSWYWITAATTVALTAGVVWQGLHTAEREAQRYGTPVTVAVAAHSLNAGSRVDAGDVTMTRLPASMVPAGALGSLRRDARLRSDVVEGEVLVESRLTSHAVSAGAAQLARHERGVALPLPDAHLDLHRGDLVDVMALTEDAGTEVIAHRARVLAAHDRTVVVAVDESDVAALGDSLVAATVSLALVGE